MTASEVADALRLLGELPVKGGNAEVAERLRRRALAGEIEEIEGALYRIEIDEGWQH
jgi:hypothetical protein